MPVMCSYKVVKVKFEVWGMQGKVESFTQKVIGTAYHFSSSNKLSNIAQ